MDIGGKNFTNFQNVRVVGSVGSGTGVIRFVEGGGSSTGDEGTLTILALEASRSWYLPDKSGTFPIAGSFAIQLPSIGANTNIQTTVVTVGGIRTSDALVVTVNGGTSAGYGAINNGASGATSRILFQALPGAGNITISFVNLGVATGYVEFICSYAAMRTG